MDLGGRGRLLSYPDKNRTCVVTGAYINAATAAAIEEASVCGVEKAAPRTDHRADAAAAAALPHARRHLPSGKWAAMMHPYAPAPPRLGAMLRAVCELASHPLRASVCALRP